MEKTTIQGDGYTVTIPDESDADTPVIATVYEDKLEQFENDILMSATHGLDSGLGGRLFARSDTPVEGLYSARYPSEDMTAQTLTPEEIDELADGLQKSLTKTLQLNNIVRRYIITNDIIGKTYESIESNVNTQYTLSFPDLTGRNKTKKLETAKALIRDFNEQINIKQIIRECIPLTYCEGTYITCLRYDETKGYVADHYPLGVAYISDYDIGGKPVVCIDVKKLENALKKTYSKDKKNKAIFYQNIKEDIKNCYPPEVYDAYKAGNSICRLDVRYTGVVRIGNLGRSYGVSPIVRALKSALMLENYENTDYINAKARGKKVLVQIMRKETMQDSKGAYNKKGFDIQAKAHLDLMSAWKARTVAIYTAVPQVESVDWVVDKTPDTNSDKINIYRSKIMSTLGIGFTDNNNANFSIANISLDQLMRTINSISEQLERVFRDWYRIVLENNNVDVEYLPEIHIIDAEALDMDIKKDLVEVLFSKLNCSYETCYNLLGLNIEDERQKRMRENENNFDSEIFTPHSSQYTSSSSDNSAGRPADSDNTDKQNNDEQYYKDVSN